MRAFFNWTTPDSTQSKRECREIIKRCKYEVCDDQPPHDLMFTFHFSPFSNESFRNTHPEHGKTKLLVNLYAILCVWESAPFFYLSLHHPSINCQRHVYHFCFSLHVYCYVVHLEFPVRFICGVLFLFEFQLAQRCMRIILEAWVRVLSISKPHHFQCARIWIIYTFTWAPGISSCHSWIKNIDSKWIY